MNNIENYQKNLKIIIEGVSNDFRQYKIIDGLKFPNTKAKVFFRGEVENLGGDENSTIEMSKIIQNKFCDILPLIKEDVLLFYKKNELIELLEKELKSFSLYGHDTKDHEDTIKYLKTDELPLSKKYGELLDATINDFETVYLDYKI